MPTFPKHRRTGFGGRPTHRSHRPRRSHRMRLLVVVCAPLVALVPLAAGAATQHPAKAAKTAKAVGSSQTVGSAQVAAVTVTPKLVWSRSWSPALALLVNGRTAGFKSLPLSYHTLAGQEAIATATFRTNWVDVRALKDGPNIAQQGLSIHPPQFKLQIAHGATPASHRGDCHIAGATGHVLAYGPAIDVADGKWHTITCIKYPDTANGTKVVVIVDGVAGKPKWSHTPIGNILATGGIRLGGRSSLASTDSLDGWIRQVKFSLS